MLRAIREIKPRYVVGENVRGIISWDGGLVFDQVQLDLEAEGYEVIPVVLPACGVNAPHRRERTWFIAYCDIGVASDTESVKNNRWGQSRFQSEPARSGFEGVTTDTHSSAEGSPGESGGVNSQRSKDSVFSGERGEPTELNNRSSVFSSFAPDTSNVELQRGKFNRSSGSTGATEADSRQSGGSVCSKWQEFPTQPPICGGDDGLPRELDGITFPKWRSESIKAYGNAIVPQVAYEIFKVIENLHFIFA